jgi:multiple sugar transport system substrate-binding protein
MRKIVVLVAGLLIAIAAITGCSNRGSERGKVILRFWSHQNVPWNINNEEFIAGFMEENPGISIEYEAFPYGDFEQKTQTALISKTGGADIFELWGGWVLDFSPTGALAPVPEQFINELKADSYEPVLASFFYDGKYYGVPIEFNAEYGGMLVLKPYFDSHNIKYPSTWDEAIGIAREHAVTRNGVMELRGFDYIGSDTLLFTYLSMILSKGGTYLEDGGHRFNFNTPIAREALQKLRDYILVDKITSIDAFLGGNPGVDYYVFMGESLMAPRGMWTIPTGKEMYDAELGVDIDYIPSPFYGPEKKWAAETGWGLVVNSGTSHPDEAWKFVEYCLRPENIFKSVVARGNIPPRRSVAKDPAYLAAIPYAKPIVDVLDGASYVGYINTDVMKEELDNAFIDMIQNGVSVEATLQRFTDNANARAK